MQPIKFLVMWSGGIDSTYTLAKMLKETDHEIFAHHIHFVNAEGRVKEELKAIRSLTPKLKAIRDFKLSESLIDHRQSVRIPFDMAVVCFEAGARQKDLSFQGKKIDKWTIGTHQAEGHWQERWEVISPATLAASWPYPVPDFEIQPMATKEKEMEYLDSLGLLSDCWFCRVPRTGKPCGLCKTCLEVKDSSKEKIWQTSSQS